MQWWINEQNYNGILIDMPHKKSVENTQKSHKKVANQYDNDNYNYLKYWDGRDYEHAAEEMAIKRLIRGKHFKHAVDIGGGYGRLCVLLNNYADHVTLAEPATSQLEIAKDFLKDYPTIDQKLMQADDLQFKDGSVDLFTMIRVMHHLPDPHIEFAEMHRSLSNDGYVILELANYAHFRNRVKYLLKGKKLPVEPIDIRSVENQREEEIAFVNHNPKTIITQLNKAGFKVEKILSVSNLRSPGLKKIVPRLVMLSLENIMQPALSRTFFGPSVFFLLKKQ